MDTIAIIGPKGIPKDFPGTSGIEAYVENQLHKLVKQSIVRCYVRTWASPSNLGTYHDAQLIRLPTINTKHFDAFSYSLLASILAAFSDATIVWYHGIGPAFFSFIPKLFGKHIYTTIHSLDYDRKKWSLIPRIILQISERVSFANSHHIYVVSKRLHAYYATKYKKATIIDQCIFPKQHKLAPNIIRRKYDLKKNGYVLYLGRFVPEKRIEWLLKASKDIPTIPFVLSGGSSHTDRYVRSLKRSSSNHIVFTGYVFGKEKTELLSNCKMLVLPSQLEGFSISVIEALSYNKPCLLGDFLKEEYSRHNKLIHYYHSTSYNSFLTELKKLI